MAEAVASKRPAGDLGDYGGENVAPQGEQGECTGWTVDTLHQHMKSEIDNLRQAFKREIDDLRDMLAERYQTQTKAVDAAFFVQQTAMAAALTAAERAVSTAMLAAEKAVAKAEAAADKRFEAGNGLRQQLAAQASTFISRDEVEVRIRSVTEKLDIESSRTTERITALSSRADVTKGQETGSSESRANTRLDNGQLLAAAGFLVALVAVASQFMP